VGNRPRCAVMSRAALVAGVGAAWRGPSPAGAVCARSAARTLAARSDWSTRANPPAALEVGYGGKSCRTWLGRGEAGRGRAPPWPTQWSARASSSGCLRRRRVPRGAAIPWHSPPHRRLPPRIDAASRSPRPAWRGALHRVAAPGPATLQCRTTADRSAPRDRRLSSSFRHRAAHSTMPGAACR
jgi:hypothetical protein